MKFIIISPFQKDINGSLKEAQKELRFRDNFLRAVVNIKYIMDKADFEVSNETEADSPVREIIKYLEGSGIIKSE